VVDAHYLSVGLGKVESFNMDSFHMDCIDEIEVYYNDRLPQMYKTITVTMEKFLFVKRLVASGKRN